MKNLEIKNIKSHPSLSLAKANASRDLQINFNQAEDALTIPAESRHDYKCGFATQSGRSMIEMLGVLAIIGVLSVGGIAGYSKAMMKYRINKTIEQITLIAGNVRSFFAPQGNYGGVDNSTILRKAKLVPDEMWEYKDDGTFRRFTNVFGNSVYLREVSPIYFRIEYIIPLDYDVCIELMSHDWTAAGVKGIGLHGPSSPSAMMPISIETAVDKCSSWIKTFTSISTSSESGTMAFYFDLKNNCTISGQSLKCS